MTDDDILYELDCDYPFPRAALLAATERRAALAPRLIAEIDRCVARPTHPANRPTRLLLAVHLLAQWREKAAYRSLCRMLRLPNEMLADLLYFGLADTAARVLTSVFDGDPQPLYDLALDEDANEQARFCAFEALAVVTALDQTPIAETERFLREAFDRLQPREGNEAWAGWEAAIADLGLEGLAPLVRRAHDMGAFGSTWNYAEFESILRFAIANDSASLKGGGHFKPQFDDTIEELEGWYYFSEHAQREWQEDQDGGWLADWTPSKPHTNPYRDVGRNDPCPCGSGLKFKRCHGKT